MGKMSESVVEGLDALDNAYRDAITAEALKKPYAKEMAYRYDGMLSMFKKLTGMRVETTEGFHEIA